MEITVTILDKEAAVLESWMGVGEIFPWLQSAINNEIRQRVDASILEETAFNPAKLARSTKIAELEKIILPTREERDAKQ